MLNDITPDSTTPAAVEAPAAPAVEKAAPAPAITDKESTADKVAREERELDDDLRKVFRKANTPREDDGKFAPKDGQPKAEPPAKPLEAKEPAKAEKAEEPGKVVPGKPVEPAKPAVPAPQSWKAEIKEKWATLPPEVQTYITERETEAHKRISALGQRASQIDEMVEVFKPHAGRMNGTSPKEYMNYLLTADAALSRDPVQFIKSIADHYRIDLNSMVSDPYAVSDPQSAQWQATLNAANAKIEHLERQLGEVRTSVIGRETAERQAQEAQFDNIVSEFSNGKEDWSQLLPSITALVPGLLQANPGMQPKDVLQQAYEQAQWANPTTRKALLERQAKEAQAKALEDAKEQANRARRASSINVRNAPPHANGAASLDDDLRGVWRRLNAN